MHRVLYYLRRPRLLLIGLFGVAMVLAWFGLWVGVLPIRPRVVIPGEGMRPLQFDATGERLATLTDDENGWVLRLWDCKTGEELIGPVSLPRPREPNASLSPDGRYFIYPGGSPSAFRVIELPSGKEVAVLQVDDWMAWWTYHLLAPDGKTLAYSTVAKRSHTKNNWPAPEMVIKLFDLQTKSTRGTIPADVISGFSPDSQLLAVGHFQPRIRGEGEDRIDLWDALRGECVKTLRGIEGFAIQASFNSDSSLLATSCSPMQSPSYFPERVYVFEIATGRLMATLDHCTGAAFLDGDRLLMTSCDAEHHDGAALKLWDTRCWKETLAIPKVVPESHVLHMVIEDAGSLRTLICESYEREPNATQTWLGRMLGKDSWTKPRRLILTRIVDRRTGAEVVRFTLPAFLGEYKFSADGLSLAVVHRGDTEETEVHIYDVPPRRPVALYLLLSALPALLFTALLWWRVR